MGVCLLPSGRTVQQMTFWGSCERRNTDRTCARERRNRHFANRLVNLRPIDLMILARFAPQPREGLIIILLLPL